MVVSPQEKIIKEFVTEYYHRRRWEIEQAFFVSLPLLTEDKLAASPIADALADIARAAGGEIPHSDDGDVEGIIYEAVQDVCERLFAPPGLVGCYMIPPAFWETPIGEMLARALIWCQRDELITIRKAARLAGVTVQAISAAIDAGRLRAFTDPGAPRRQGRRLVRRNDILSQKLSKTGKNVRTA